MPDVDDFAEDFDKLDGRSGKREVVIVRPSSEHGESGVVLRVFAREAVHQLEGQHSGRSLLEVHNGIDVIPETQFLPILLRTSLRWSRLHVEGDLPEFLELLESPAVVALHLRHGRFVKEVQHVRLEDIKLVTQILIYFALSDEVMMDDIADVALFKELFQLSFSESEEVNM